MPTDFSAICPLKLSDINETHHLRIRHVHEPRMHLLATLEKGSEPQKSTKFC